MTTLADALRDSLAARGYHLTEEELKDVSAHLVMVIDNAETDEIERMRCLAVEFVSCLDDDSIAILPGLKEDGATDCHHDARCGCPQAIVARDARRVVEQLKTEEAA